MIFIGVGSSIGNATDIFGSAKQWLESQEIKVLQQSGQLKNPPYGGVAQNEFTNAVWQIDYPENQWEKINWVLLPARRRQYLKAKKLMRLLQRCEKFHGRKPAARWSDRPLDLDILVFHSLAINKPHLTLPHPEIPHRLFVLQPWAEIVDKNFEIPKFGKIGDLIQKLNTED